MTARRGEPRPVRGGRGPLPCAELCLSTRVNENAPRKCSLGWVGPCLGRSGDRGAPAGCVPGGTCALLRDWPGTLGHSGQARGGVRLPPTLPLCAEPPHRAACA